MRVIEKAARALQEDIGLDPGEAVDAARAVFRAIREPDEGMALAAVPWLNRGHIAIVWRRMIDAALGED